MLQAKVIQRLGELLAKVKFVGVAYSFENQEVLGEGEKRTQSTWQKTQVNGTPKGLKSKSWR